MPSRKLGVFGTEGGLKDIYGSNIDKTSIDLYDGIFFLFTKATKEIVMGYPLSLLISEIFMTNLQQEMVAIGRCWTFGSFMMAAKRI